MRAAIIINPSSGAYKSRASALGSREVRVRRVLDAMRISADVRVTTRREHAAELSAELLSAGIDRVIVWGGDGTVNEAAGPLFGSQATLGIIPGGSGDGLARALNLPRDPETAIRHALTGRARAIDVGWLGGRHFLSIAGIGFDAEVARRFELSAKRGLATYLKEALLAVWTYRSALYRISADGRRFDGRRFLIAFANGCQYGNGLRIAPDADPADGQLNMILVDDGSPLRQLWRTRRIGFRPLKPAEGIIRERVTSAEISGSAMICHVDGELFESSGDLELRITPRALKIIVDAE